MTEYPAGRRLTWRLAWGFVPPLVLFSLLVALVVFGLNRQLEGEGQYDEVVLREWIQEARVFRQTLSELVRAYLVQMSRAEPGDEPDIFLLESIQAHLATLGDLTRSYRGQLPLFPVIYRMTLNLPPPGPTVDWNALLPYHGVQARVLTIPVAEHQGLRAELRLEYQLHAFAQSPQELVQRQRTVRRGLGLAVVAAAFLAVAWVVHFLRRERQRDAEAWQTMRRADEAEKRALEEQLARQRAEIAHEEAERTLLQQRVATQQAEAQALELQSQLFANMSIMAGSYAHNIKNLLVRPQDLLRRIADEAALPETTRQRVDEVRDTLDAVTERTQQILRTVRRDPTRVTLEPLEVGPLLRELARAWSDLAEQRWKADFTVECADEPMWIQADRSHLEQALENLICNARDATFEQRAWLRNQAREHPEATEAERKHAVIAAAAWRGQISLGARTDGDQVEIIVRDNGIGMTAEVLRQCTETHFTTKKANAVYEGIAVGMGLGLSFARAIVANHHGTLTIDSVPHQGTRVRLRFARVPAPRPAAPAHAQPSA